MSDLIAYHPPPCHVPPLTPLPPPPPPPPHPQEFLKSQFSHENIYFWVACERYKQLSEVEARRQVALQIYERHLCVGAPEPVNVDSQAQQAAQDGVDQAAVTLFDKVRE